MKRKPNIATVAERAGVAVSTVSRYLNDRYVSQKARARIASMLPVSLAVTTSGSPFLSGDVLISSLAFSGLWVILLLFLEWRRGRKAIPH